LGRCDAHLLHRATPPTRKESASDFIPASSLLTAAPSASQGQLNEVGGVFIFWVRAVEKQKKFAPILGETSSAFRDWDRRVQHRSFVSAFHSEGGSLGRR